MLYWLYWIIGVLFSFAVGFYAYRLYWWLLYKITPTCDWYVKKPKMNFWRFWK